MSEGDVLDAGRLAGTDSGRPTIPVHRYGNRLERARALAAQSGLMALLVGVGADLRYLTGYTALPLERLTMLVLPTDGPATLVVPRLEVLPAHGSPAATAGAVEVVAWEETEDAVALVAALVHASAGPGGGRSPDGGPRGASAAGTRRRTGGRSAAGGRSAGGARAASRAGSGAGGGASDVLRLAVSDRLLAMFLLRLQAELPAAAWSVASTVLGRLRVVKDPDEIELLRLAAEAADRAVMAIAAGELVGRTEADVAREVRERLVAEGHDSAEFAIVASGPESASPHHEASDRVIRPGEPVVLDIGGPLGGYGSDITRTVWVTGGDRGRGPDEEFRRIHAVVRDAQSAATEAARPGVRAEDVDAAARRVIADGGYGERFIHRVGHGIGLEGHEDPYLVAGNGEPLEPGMAFSIEPGIYLEGRYGVRLEDIVVCGPDGPIVLNRAPRELLVVPG